jgi:hypothetical protein
MILEPAVLLFLLARLAAAAALLAAVYFRGTNLACQALAFAVRHGLSRVVKVFRIGLVTMVPLHIEG